MEKLKIMIVRKNKIWLVYSYVLIDVLVFTFFHNVVFAENSADYVSVPPLMNISSSGDKPNVLFVLDNSNSMGEAPSGQAVGSANVGSKSEIARNAVKNIIATFSKLATAQFANDHNSTNLPRMNAGLTLIEGSLQSAEDYFSGTLQSEESSIVRAPLAPLANTCGEKNYVILVTDGLPNVDEDGNLTTNTNDTITGATAIAAELLGQGVKTYVVGFALPTGADGSLLNAIASAGGTGMTYMAVDSETLLRALESIFLSFDNRDASSSSSAVLANNSRGEGAVFQAIYSPQKEDRLGNKVSWVGNLFGLFLDGNGFLREDSDGDHVLDDYLIDRVVHYYFDSGLGKTQVKRFYGSDATTPPSDVENGTPFDTLDVDDIAVLWDARDQLGEITDVLTQRPYGDDASTGRHILSSVDGVSSVGFMQVSQEYVNTAVKHQSDASDALADARKILNVAIVQFDGAVETVQDFSEQQEALVQGLKYFHENQEIFGELEQGSSRAQEEVRQAERIAEEATEALSEARTLLDNTESDGRASVEIALDNALKDLANANRTVRELKGSRDGLFTKLGDATTKLNEARAVLTAIDESLPEAEVSLVAKGAALILNADELRTATEESKRSAQNTLNYAQEKYDDVTTNVMGNDTLINYLDVPSIEQAYKTVKYVRGEEVEGFRSRMLDYDDDGVLESWRLGDIVHSSPALVGAPNDLYDAKYRDKTYGVFRELHKNRRNVLYVGANDGMLHAFNAGFWDLSNKSFEESNSFVGGNATAHPLGSELWAYVPRSSLPHLQWMTNPNYAHAYYVDGSPVVFDANIFTADASHPFGWGTVLIVGMRFGGSDIKIDVDGDGIDDTEVSSSYVLFDVTNPEVAPVFIAELSEPGFGYTTSVPTVIKKRVKGTGYRSPAQNDWYVAFGSGPTELDDASSTQNAGLYLYDLKTRDFVRGFDPLIVRASSFIGDITSYDSGKNFVDNVLYYGVSGGAPASGSNGALLRTLLDKPVSDSTSTVIDTQEPVLSAPIVRADRFGRRRITFGTGRLLTSTDSVTSESRHYFGVVEPLDERGSLTYATILESDLEDVTDIDVVDSGLISRGGVAVEIPSGNNVETFRELVQAIRLNKDGWVLELHEGGGTPSERSISRGATANNVLFFTTYTPSINVCFPEGTSDLYGVDVRTGTAIPFEVFAVGDDPVSSEGNTVNRVIKLKQSLASAPIVIHNSGGTTAFTSKLTTEQMNTYVRTTGTGGGRQSWRQLVLE